MSNKEAVQAWRTRAKTRLVQGLGGKCNKCGYDRCIASLDFHHLRDKKFTVAQALTNPKSWAVLVEEASKCILLCGNCHNELHYGLWKIEDIQVFEASFAELEKKVKEPTGKCPMCDKDVFKGQITCSASCRSKRTWTMTWPEPEVVGEMLRKMPMSAVADLLGVSFKGLKSWSSKRGLICTYEPNHYGSKFRGSSMVEQSAVNGKVGSSSLSPGVVSS